MLVVVVVVVATVVVDYYYFQAPLLFHLSHQEPCIPCFLFPVSFPAADSYTIPSH